MGWSQSNALAGERIGDGAIGSTVAFGAINLGSSPSPRANFRLIRNSRSAYPNSDPVDWSAQPTRIAGIAPNSDTCLKMTPFPTDPPF
jgi:hypothetical protein